MKEAKLTKYQAIYKEKGLDVALQELKNDKKNTNWIMFYKGKLFPDKKRSEIKNAIQEFNKNEGFRRR